MKIHSTCQVLGGLDLGVEPIGLKNTTMLFQCDWDHALEYTKRDRVTPVWSLMEWLQDNPECEDWLDLDVMIDTRVHMLMPGWYPCIPGWHHDAVPRSSPDGQPDYSEGAERSAHLLLLLGDPVANTEFALGTAEFTDPRKLRIVYQDWHLEVNQAIAEGKLQVAQAIPGTIIQFDDRCFHRGVAAKANGWRYFIRLSRFFDANGKRITKPAANEVRHQCQVYMDNPNAGW